MSHAAVCDKVCVRTIQRPADAWYDIRHPGIYHCVYHQPLSICQTVHRAVKWLDLKYTPLDVPLFAINSIDTVVYQVESFEMMRQRAIAGNFLFPYFYFNEQTVGKNYGADHTPHAYIIWKEDLEWIVRYRGAIEDNDAEPQDAYNVYIDKAVQELLAEMDVTVTETKSVGCTIYNSHKYSLAALILPSQVHLP